MGRLYYLSVCVLLTLVLYRPLCSTIDYKKFTRGIIYDALAINKHLLSTDSLKIMLAATPVYCLAYSFDKQIQRCFYHKKKHNNIRQLPAACNYFTRAIITSSLVSASLLILSPDKHIHTVARMFLIGLPFTGITKVLLKLPKWPGARRPPNAHFDKNRCYYGGFPSGHMVEMAYITSLFALEFGWWALPYTFGALYVATDFMVSNRHYLSQLVAGAAIGALWGVAVHKTVQDSLKSFIYCTVTIDHQGCPAIAGIYNF